MENGDGSRMSPQCSLEVLLYKAFQLPREITSLQKTGTLFWWKRRKVSSVVLQLVSNQNAPQIHMEVEAGKTGCCSSEMTHVFKMQLLYSFSVKWYQHVATEECFNDKNSSLDNDSAAEKGPWAPRTPQDSASPVLPTAAGLVQDQWDRCLGHFLKNIP